MDVLWREPGSHRYSRRENENSRWSDIDRSPSLTLCCQTDSAVSLPSCISLHADLRTRRVPSFWTQTPQPVFWLVPGGLETRALAYSKRVLILASPCFCFSPTDSAYKHQSAASFTNFQPSRCSVMCKDWSSLLSACFLRFYVCTRVPVVPPGATLICSSV